MKTFPPLAKKLKIQGRRNAAGKDMALCGVDDFSLIATATILATMKRCF